MQLNELCADINEWLSGAGPMSEIIISSRVRLARNLSGHRFVSHCSSAEKAEVLAKLKTVLMAIDLGDDVFFVGVDESSNLHRSVLVERHLISRHHAMGKGPRGAVIARGEFFTGMINEEDHLRIQVLKPGCQLQACAEQINRIDDLIEQQVEYAFSRRFGYLTACPTNVGSGIRVSVMVHLPALKLVGHLERFLNAAKAMNLAVRGLFGEGTEATSDLYQISNQVTLGIPEPDIIEDFEKRIIPEVVGYENAARRHLLADRSTLLDDKISRAMALLQNAHLISSQEALVLLSHLRLGMNMRTYQEAATPAINQLSALFEKRMGQDLRQAITTINRLFMLTLPAHLQVNHGKALEPGIRDEVRAQVIRAALGQVK